MLRWFVSLLVGWFNLSFVHLLIGWLAVWLIGDLVALFVCCLHG